MFVLARFDLTLCIRNQNESVQMGDSLSKVYFIVKHKSGHVFYERSDNPEYTPEYRNQISRFHLDRWIKQLHYKQLSSYYVFEVVP